MKYLLILLFPLSALGQSVSVAPTSFSGWGETPTMSEINISFEGLGLHYFFPYQTQYLDAGDKYYPTKSSLAVSYKPINGDILKAGVIVFGQKWPVAGSGRFNFLFNIGYDFNGFRLAYQHISNGELYNENPGLDSIVLTVSL